MKALLVISILALWISTTESTTCFVQNSIPSVFTQVCPGNIYTCMKFDCKVNNPKKFKQTTKGCNDPGNALVACTQLMTQCQAQGGTGQCYTCNGDYCNSSPTSFAALLSIAIPAVTYFLLH
ncbi:hypothetical protein CAEBREN_03700 [Caenorhabditis brenneri]|uniref:Uncharacterized protein n=1 Tax=Caenorhabditis brenneri TaxID=135651 RepID=G0NZ13_CAEBE|nr:hypothetical protein CAEBREN_03700 [Caenorhabditis brenneri]